jgi:YceI-like domain
VVVGKEPGQCSVDVTIDANSLSTQNAMRNQDVKGPDFFDAARFPDITYKGKGILTRELLDEIGKLSNAPDVSFEIDAEALGGTSAPATR